MKYTDIISSAVGHHIDLSNASDEDKDRFITAFELQQPDVFETISEQIIKKTHKEPSNDEVFDSIVSRAKMNFFDPDDLNQIAYSAGFTGVDK